MDCRIERIDAFYVMGVEREFALDTAFSDVPKFWDEYMREGLCQKVCGCLGICFDECDGSGRFRYMIADNCNAGDTPFSGFIKREIPTHTWAKFRATGPMPHALQALNRAVYTDWAPNNGEYAIAAGMNIEMYTMGDMDAEDYVTELWIPVKKK